MDTTGARDFFDYELTRIKTNFLMLRGNALFAPLVAKIKLVPSRVAQYRFLECARERVPVFRQIKRTPKIFLRGKILGVILHLR